MLKARSVLQMNSTAGGIKKKEKKWNYTKCHNQILFKDDHIDRQKY